MSAIRTALPFPTQPWEAARDEFIEGLSAEEKQRFSTAKLENIFYDASASQKRYAKSSRSWAIQERLSPLLDGIDDYGKALDVYSNSYGLILCPIWGSIRVVLHIAREAGRFQEKIVDMFGIMGDTLPRFHIYEQLFGNHERLLRAISMAYLDILKFSIRVKNFFGHARKTPLPLSIVCKAIWKPFRQEFDTCVMNFRQHQKSVEKAAGLAHMIESARRRDVEKANQALQKHNAKIRKRHDLLSVLQTVDYQSKHRAIADLRHPGTNAWVQDDTRYISWLDSSKSECLCCYGIPGAGKSVLASSVVESLHQTLDDPGSLLCYYYFDYADSRSLEPNYLLGSLTKQILTRLPLDLFGESLELPDDGQAFRPFAEQISSLTQLLRNFSKAFIVLDGLDELDKGGQNAILQLVEALVQASGSLVKVFVTSRIEEPLIRKRLHAYVSFELTPTSVSSDISLSIQHELQIAAESSPILRDPEMRKEVNDALTAGANGMFLWVKFQMYDICEAVTKTDIRNTIRTLPKDLRETYVRIIARMYSSPGGSTKLQTMKRVLRWVSCAKRPLDLEELEEALAIEIGDTYLHTDRIVANSGEKIVASCGNLIVYNRENGTVKFAHPTVRQFLCSQPPEEQRIYLQLLNLDIATVDMEIGETCVAYLSFSDFKTQVTTTSTSTGLERTQAEQIIWSQVPMASRIQKFMARKKVSSNRGMDGYAQQIYHFPRHENSTSPELKSKYTLLEYIIDYWAFHTSGFTESNRSWAAFSHVTLHRNLPFEFRPWRVAPHLNDLNRTSNPQYPWMAMYVWSMNNCIGSFLKLLGLHYTFDFQDYLFRKYMVPYEAGGINIPQAISDYQNLISSCSYNYDCSTPVEEVKYESWARILVNHLAEHFKWEPTEPAAITLLGVLLRELEDVFTGDSKGREKKIMEEAMVLAAKENATTFSIIVSFQRPSFEQLSRIIVSAVNGTAHLKDEVLETFFYAEVKYQKPEVVDPDLLSALSRCLAMIIEGLWTNRLNPGKMNQHCVWIVTLLCLSTPNLDGEEHSAALIELFSALDYAYLHWQLKLGPTEASDEKRTGLLSPIQGASPFEMVFQRLHMEPSEHFKFVIGELPSGVLEGIPVERLENEGCHCLKWAAENDMPNIVALLMPQYQDFLCPMGTESEEIHFQICQDILLAAMQYSQPSLVIMLQCRWPRSLVRTVIRTRAFEQLMASTQSIMLEVADLKGEALYPKSSTEALYGD